MIPSLQVSDVIYYHLFKPHFQYGEFHCSLLLFFFFFFFGLINDTVVTNLVFASLAILWLKVSLKAWNHQRRRDTQWDWCGWWDQTEQAPEGMVWILSIMSKGEPLKNIAQGSHRAGFVSLKAQPSCRSAPGQGPLTYGVSLAPIPAWLSLEPIFQVSPTSPPVHGRLKISLRPHPSLHGTLFTDCFWTAMLCLHLGLISDLQRRGWPVTGGNSIQPPSCRQSWGRRQNRAGERRLIVSWQELEGTGFQGPQCSPRARLDGHGDEKWSQQPVDSDLIREMQENCEQVEDFAMAGIKLFMLSWVLFFSSVHLAALVQGQKKWVVGFTQGWDIFRVSGREGQREKDYACVHKDNCEGGFWIWNWLRRK